MTTDVYYKLDDLADVSSWPIASLVPEAIDAIRCSAPAVDHAANSIEVGLFLDVELAIKVPGLDFLTLAVAPSGSGTAFDLVVELSPFKFAIRNAPIVLRVDADVLCPVRSTADGGVEPVPGAKTLDIVLGTIGLEVGVEGGVGLRLEGTNITIPRCMIGSTGVVLGVGSMAWVGPATAPDALPPNTPAGFTRIDFADVKVELPQLSMPLGTMRLGDVFIGTGGFSGTATWEDPTLRWRGNAHGFEGVVAGELLGFKGGMSKVRLGFRQSSFTECE